MSRKSNGISPPMPKVIRLDENSRRWLRKPDCTGYTSEDGDFEIIASNGYARLVSLIHEPPAGEPHWQKRCRTIKAAMEYAEKI